MALSRIIKAEAVFRALRWQPMYRGAFAGYEDMIVAFQGYSNNNPLDNQPTEDEVIFACYENEAYEGSALVIFMHQGKLYEVSGSHCSCYGLEDCWKPEETSWDAIKMRTGGYRGFDGLNEVIAEWS
jgi:hypothetical protein